MHCHKVPEGRSTREQSSPFILILSFSLHSFLSPSPSSNGYNVVCHANKDRFRNLIEHAQKICKNMRQILDGWKKKKKMGTQKGPFLFFFSCVAMAETFRCTIATISLIFFFFFRFSFPHSHPIFFGWE